MILIDRDPDLRRLLGAAGLRDVQEFDMHRVARQFLSEVSKVVPGVAEVEKREAAYAP